MTLADNRWHHVCVVWEADAGLLTMFKDGERKLQSNEFWSNSEGNCYDKKINFQSFIRKLAIAISNFKTYLFYFRALIYYTQNFSLQFQLL